ncbi:hypothetical protein DRQ36_08525 [bacterium]|nr:MAG: hypothetical protein DRQ36_08525 [bacterium]
MFSIIASKYIRCGLSRQGIMSEFHVPIVVGVTVCPIIGTGAVNILPIRAIFAILIRQASLQP